MPKRKTLIFLTALLATVGLFAVSEVIAQVERPTRASCGNGNYIIETNPDVDFPYFADAADEKCINANSEYVSGWVFEYKVTCKNSKACADINKWYWYFNNSPPLTFQVIAKDVDTRGMGVTGGEFGLGIYNGHTASINPLAGGDSITKILRYCADIETTGLVSTSPSVKSGILGCEAIDDLGEVITDDYGAVGGIIGAGIDPLVNLIREFEYDSITGSGGMCIRKKIDGNFCIEALDYACYDPETEACPNDNLTWIPVSYTIFEAEYFGGHDPNVKCEGTLQIVGKHDTIASLCPDNSTESFMDFLRPSEAYAACTCPPGFAFTSGRKNYCICF